MSSLLIRDGMLVDENGVHQKDVLIDDGIVTEVAPGLSKDCEQVVDANGKVIFPGFIDCHVHFREPGTKHMQDAETMTTGAVSAKHGGVSTTCEMPNTVPPTCTVDAAIDKATRAEHVEKKGNGDVRFFFLVTERNHLSELETLFRSTDENIVKARKRCCGLKLFLEQSTGNQKVDPDVIEDAFALCADLTIPVVAHCEDPALNEQATQKNTRTDVAAHSIIRSPESEAASIEFAIEKAAKHNTQFHIAHLSTQQGLELVRNAKAEEKPVTCQVAPHHLFLSTEDYEDLGTLCKMNPPVRAPEHRIALWNGVIDGTVDCIATDHAPHTLESKHNPEMLNAPSGVPGVETMIPLLLSCMKHEGPLDRHGHTRLPGKILTLERLFQLCFWFPNDYFKLGKPGITPGKPQNLCIVDLEKTWKVSGKALHSKCGWTPYEHWELTGWIDNVIL